MKNIRIALSSMGLLCSLVCWGQFPSREQMDSINKVTETDYQNMLDQLGISSLRPGPSGNPQAANAANADEAKATQYTSLPDPLLFNNGKKVKTAAQWSKRRTELFELFDSEMYGRLPKNIPDVHWNIVREYDTLDGDTSYKLKELIGHVDNSAYPEIDVDIQLIVGIPSAINEQVPIMLEFGWDWRKFSWGTPPTGASWREQLLKKGWGFAIMVPGSVQADNGAGLTQGIIGLVNKGEYRKPDDWGALRAWAWGASKVVDYFETDKSIDASHIGIEGLSRYGKAALVTMAYEPRIAIGFIGSSGAGGAKILRRVFGEQVENLASSAEYHWFAGNFIKYAGPLQVNDLPVDAHELVALCAPRPLFISSGAANVEGNWIDAKGMFLGGVYASPVYELLGKQGMGADRFEQGVFFINKGDIVCRRHEGGHTTGPNWPYFIDFASKYFD